MPIFEAVAAASAVRGPNGRVLAPLIQQAMTAAVEKALADGLRPDEDAAEIRERMQQARESAKALFYSMLNSRQVAPPLQAEPPEATE